MCRILLIEFMSFKKKLWFNLVIHSLGSLSSFLSLCIILYIYGVEKQGIYANLMALISFIGVLGVFGFPQGYIYLINKLNISAKRLCLFSVYFSFAIFILLLIILYFNYYFNLNWIDGELVSNSNFILFSIATVSLILHGLLRGIYLTINQGVGFAFYSILPAITILGCVGFGIIFEYSNLQELVLISAVLVLFFSVYIVIKINKLNDDFSIYKIPFKELFNHGTHSFLQALFYSAQPLFAFWAIKHYNGGYQDVGYFNIGLFVLQGFLVPVTMLSPYLFEYFTKNSSTNILKIISKNKFYFYDLILAIFLYFSVGVIDSFFFDSEYVIPIKLIQIILFSLPFNIHYRIFLPYIHAKGFPKYNTLFCIVRLLLFVLLSFLFIYFKFNVLVSLAICWSFSEIIVFLWIIISIKKIIIYDSL